MNHRTKRRAVLGGLVTVAVGGAGHLLGRRQERSRWLRPVESLRDSTTFAYAEGVIDRDDGDLSVEVAMRSRHDDGRVIELFADSDRPIREYMPPLRGFWRFDADVDGRPLGEATLTVGDDTLPVELVAKTPPHHDALVKLTPRVTWRSDFVAHARGYSTGDGGGRLHVVFRSPTGDPPALDALAFRTPDGEVVGRTDVPAGVTEHSFRIDPLTAFEADGELVAFRNGSKLDAVPLFYH
ncbi:hypothetical protein VB773_21035 [Haloarculaceae archaeon H-GB2-1]|nr:hypothetical protein [Haloarculaceae archaeon H-GB1-1]MEA5389394.1 hypothetical protein [Haloarculaceae archaeon H-GB11]MEA5409807.1 hypothetical protein [Haloarculaceae archaeon H-GB2-1]